jgi:hypothetical protein
MAEHEKALCADFASVVGAGDRRCLASTSHDDTLRLWDLGMLHDEGEEEEGEDDGAEEQGGEAVQVRLHMHACRLVCMCWSECLFAKRFQRCCMR